jgi:hypothetical protein
VQEKLIVYILSGYGSSTIGIGLDQDSGGRKALRLGLRFSYELQAFHRISQGRVRGRSQKGVRMLDKYVSFWFVLAVYVPGVT